jgi:hypothetical protein
MVLVNGAVVAIIAIEGLSGWRQSKNTQMAAQTDLPRFALVWGLGKSCGVLLGFALTTIWLNPHNPFWWWTPYEWPTVVWLQKLFAVALFLVEP